MGKGEEAKVEPAYIGMPEITSGHSMDKFRWESSSCMQWIIFHG